MTARETKADLGAQGYSMETAYTNVVQDLSALAMALVNAQRAIKGVEKGSRNKFHGYNYASAEDVVSACREALNSQGLSLLVCLYRSDDNEPMETTDKKGNAQTIESGMLYVEYMLLHESGANLRMHSCTPWHTENGRPPDKAIACAKTYDISYFLRGLLLLPRVEEGNEPDTRDDSKYTPRAKQPSSKSNWRQQR